MICIAILGICIHSLMGQSAKPEALRRMEESRQAMTAARIEWTRTDQEKWRCGQQREWYHTSRYSGEDHLDINHGDHEGVLFPDQLGEDLSCSELRLLKQNNEQWLHSEDTCSASVARLPKSFQPVYDIRSLGMVPAQRADLTPNRYWPEEPQLFEESIDGAIHHVTARFDHGIAFLWDIDASKGYAPQRCVMTVGGKPVSEVRCELEQFGDTWFPAQSTFFANGNEVSRIVVSDASFFGEDDARALTPNDLGIFPGTTVSREGDQSSDMWDGEKWLSPKDYFAAVKAGNVDSSQYADFLKRTQTGGQGRQPKQYDMRTFGLVDVERTPGLWEEYVRRFIRKNHLDTAATRKAWRVHRVCQRDALKYLKDQRDALAELDREFVKTKSAGESPVNAAKAVEERRDKKLAPVRRIFENHLKPGLDKLLPRKETQAPPASPVSSASDH